MDNDRYQKLGGISSVFDLFKSGEYSLKQIGTQLKKSPATIVSDFIKVFGHDDYELAKQNRKRQACVSRLNKGELIDLPFPFVMVNMPKKMLKLELAENINKLIVSMAEKITGETLVIWFKRNKIYKLIGEKGTVVVRYGIPNYKLREFELGLHRFKLSPNSVSKNSALLFCLLTPEVNSYYLIPSEDLGDLKSLNLQFKFVKKNNKYTKYLLNVEYS